MVWGQAGLVHPQDEGTARLCVEPAWAPACTVWSCLGLEFCGASAPMKYGTSAPAVCAWAGLRLCGAPVPVWGQHECVSGRVVRNGFYLPSISLALGSLAAPLVFQGLGGSITRVPGVWQWHPLSLQPWLPFLGPPSTPQSVIQPAGCSLGFPLGAGL